MLSKDRPVTGLDPCPTLTANDRFRIFLPSSHTCARWAADCALVPDGVEGITRRAEGSEPEAHEFALQYLGDALKAAGDFSLSGLIDGVEDGEEAGEHVGHGRLVDRAAVAEDPLAVSCRTRSSLAAGPLSAHDVHAAAQGTATGGAGGGEAGAAGQEEVVDAEVVGEDKRQEGAG
ncbi:hypothetical protein ABT063_49640 [Streptomyces sp. NPDC002838]|uniref:hypothetical protein n=1 Tax=Streptomyces sp. NPDC002838 TaxID=3154436 RepID=UPI00331D19B5